MSPRQALLSLKHRNSIADLLKIRSAELYKAAGRFKGPLSCAAERISTRDGAAL
jgi:hypothetical protein